jgi:hypothetical protein
MVRSTTAPRQARDPAGVPGQRIVTVTAPASGRPRPKHPDPPRGPQAGGADPDHQHAAVVVRTGARRDHEALVPGLDETVDDVTHRVAAHEVSGEQLSASRRRARPAM